MINTIHYIYCIIQMYKTNDLGGAGYDNYF